MGKYEIFLQLEDEKAIEIVKGLSESERNKVIEKYIIIGDTVVKYASIVTSEESLHRFFDPVTENLRQLSGNLEATIKHLEEKIPDTLKVTLNEIAKQLEGTAKSFQQHYANYAKMLSNIFPTLAKTKRGAISCEMIFNELRDCFRDDKFEDVSSKARFTDIVATPSFSHQTILIENKDWTEPVASYEVEKFWRDMEVRNTTIGCFFSLRSPIRDVTSDFAIVPRGSMLGIFVVNAALNYRGHIFGYMVARKILEMLSRKPIMETEKYELIIKILNNRLQEFKNKMEDLEEIESEIWKTKEEVSKRLEKVAKKVSNLRNSIETLIELTFKDLLGEIE